tara:strand:+ start:646 stop:1329 length:684 start_codon:yes stop_codon:yes gene_type:complete
MTATGDWVTTYVYDGASAGPVGEIFTKSAGATGAALGIWDDSGQLIFERDKWMTWATDVIEVKLNVDMIYRSGTYYNLRIADGDIEQQTLKGSIKVFDDTGPGGPGAIGSLQGYEFVCLDVSGTTEGSMSAWLINHGNDLWVFTTERRDADNQLRFIRGRTSTGSGTGYQRVTKPDNGANFGSGIWWSRTISETSTNINNLAGDVWTCWNLGPSTSHPDYPPARILS